MPSAFLRLRYGMVFSPSRLMPFDQAPAKLFMCHIPAPSFAQMRWPSPVLVEAPAACMRSNDR